MLYKSIMPKKLSTTPIRFKRWDLTLLVLILTVSLFFAFYGRGRRERQAYAGFLERAPEVQSALERYAKDNGGRFPPDAMFTNRPKGLSDKYIKWDADWMIDYDVHDNGKGGKFICLEYCGPFKERTYLGLCQKPEYRKDYPRGEKVPGKITRLWLIREDAPVMGLPHTYGRGKAR